MAPQLDHIFICCSEGAPEGDRLVQAGLLEGPPNAHSGQGTACRRFFFGSLYLELLYLTSAVEARSPLVAPTQLYERFTDREGVVCPFGVVLRPGSALAQAPPFPTWQYRPPYLAAGQCIEVADGTPLSEPGLFHLPFVNPDSRKRVEPTPHPAGIASIEFVAIRGPGLDRMSPALEAVVAAHLIAVHHADRFVLEVHFSGSRTTPLDLRPSLPLVFMPAEGGR